MDPHEKFNAMLSKYVAPALKDKGWRRDGGTFYIREQGNWGIINFQKNRYNTKKQVSFVINLGIASQRLIDFYHFPEKISKCPKGCCHWSKRIDPNWSLLGWYKIPNWTSFEKFSNKIVQILINRAVPEILKYISDESLRDLWRSGNTTGTTHTRRLCYLSVMLKTIGPQAELGQVIEKIRNDRSFFRSDFLAEHLKMLDALK